MNIAKVNMNRNPLLQSWKHMAYSSLHGTVVHLVFHVSWVTHFSFSKRRISFCIVDDYSLSQLSGGDRRLFSYVCFVLFLSFFPSLFIRLFIYFIDLYL